MAGHSPRATDVGQAPAAAGRTGPDNAALQRDVRTMARGGTPVERAFARVGLAHAGIRGPITADSLRGLPPEVAQAVLEARGKTNNEIAKMWSESMAKIARLNKQAHEKTQVASTQERGREVQRNANYLALSRGKQWQFGLPGPTS